MTLDFKRWGVGIALIFSVAAQAQMTTRPALSSAPTNGSPWADRSNVDANAADAWYSHYRFSDGETLGRLRLHYMTLGTPHRGADNEIDNAVLVLHWTGADSKALLSAEYMRSLYGPGKPLDSSRYFLIFPDDIGHGKSSKPSDGLRAKFPHYGYRDIVGLQHRLITETLGIKHLHAILGMSMGGMNAWQWAEMYPDEVDGVMPVVSLPVKVSGRNLLWRRMVIDGIRSDPQWNKGNYTQPPTGWVSGYRLLRMMIDGVPHLQNVVPDRSAAEQFLMQADSQAKLADANDVMYSLDSSLDYDPEAGLDTIKAKVYALNFSDDEFNPDVLQTLERLMPRVKNGTYVIQAGTTSSFGHLTMAHPSLWADHVGMFMNMLHK
jgi:homoserine O-acetyltransferase/O-succinyltransferase